MEVGPIRREGIDIVVDNKKLFTQQQGLYEFDCVCISNRDF